MANTFDPRRYRITVQRVDEGGESFVKGTVAELPDVTVFGEAMNGVYAEVLEVITRLREMAQEHGKDFPGPSVLSEQFSGRVTLRVPRALHARLDDCASTDGVSLNTWIVAALAEKVGEHGVDRRAIEVFKTARLYTASQSPERIVAVGDQAVPSKRATTMFTVAHH